MTNEEMLAIGAGLGLGFLVVWFLVGKKNPAAVPAANPSVVEGVVLGEKREATDSPEPAWPVQDSDWRSELGVGADANLEEIESAYRRLCAQYDLAKLEDMAPELREVASNKLASIRAAYAMAKAQLSPASR